MKKTKFLLATIAVSLWLSIQANATVIPITNSDFETGNLNGWGSAGQAAAITDFQPLSGGSFVAFLGTAGGNGFIAQNNLVTIQSGFDYTMTIAAAAASFEPTGTFTVQLAGDGVNLFNLQNFNVVGGGGAGNAANWATYSMTLSASTIAANPTWVGQSLGIGIGMVGSAPVEVDNVTLTATAIPEPSTITFLGLGGLAGLYFLRRNRVRA